MLVGTVKVALVGFTYIHRYIRCTHGIFCKQTTIHTVIYSADIRFWPTLSMVVNSVNSAR